ncbi:hypothetical protein QYE76_021356 [Lolium multiflorum]|uniref:TF-B3 domain-containing protein n=1 Tax=Lolium multiflorum TaxID=4521 RepID=A0AAD8RAG9_LOLMU|nr:hypothetical protein QYE76_021356 [Lolium multiflorum]
MKTSPGTHPRPSSCVARHFVVAKEKSVKTPNAGWQQLRPRFRRDRRKLFHLRIALTKKFADYLDGQEPAKVYLREADCGPRLWTVEVLFDGQSRMYLGMGWEKFAIAHGVDFGCYVHFKYEGDDVLTVKVFDGTMCRRYYYSDDEDTDDESDDDVKPCIHPH